MKTKTTMNTERGQIKETDVLIQARIPLAAARAWAKLAKIKGTSRAALVRALLISRAP